MRVYEFILASVPDHAMALNLSGALACQSGKLDLAVERLTRALKFEPDNAAFHNNISEAYRRAGNLDRARIHLMRCLGIRPDNWSAYNNLGGVYQKTDQHTKAIECFSKCLDIRPDCKPAQYNFGQSLIELGRLEEAVERLKGAITRDSAFGDGRALLGEALLYLGRNEEALDRFRESVAPGSKLDVVEAATVLNSMGTTLKQLRRMDESIACFEEAVRRQPDDTVLRGNLAIALESTNRVAEAERVAKRALERDKDALGANLVLARIDLRANRLEGARRRLERLLRVARKDPLVSSVYMDLGQVCDRLGEPQRAYFYWRDGNQKLAQSPRWQRIDKEAFFRSNERLEVRLSADRFMRRPTRATDDGLMDPAFLTGFPRSGTTLLESIVAAAGFIITDERPFVDDLIRALPATVGADFRYPEDLDTLPLDAVRRLRATYWRRVAELLGGEAGHCRLLDKLPLNIRHLEFMWRVFPGARVLVVLRDPRDACLSNFMQNYEPNPAMAPFLSLEGTAAAYASVMALWLKARAALPLTYLEVRYEDLVADFDATTRRVVDFLGVAWNQRIRDFHVSTQSRYISTPSFRDVASPVHGRAVARWRRYKEYLDPVLPILEPYVSAFGYGDRPKSGD